MTKQEFVDGMIWTDLISHDQAIRMLRQAAQDHEGMRSFFAKIEDYAWEDYQKAQSDILKS